MNRLLKRAELTGHIENKYLPQKDRGGFFYEILSSSRSCYMQEAKGWKTILYCVRIKNWLNYINGMSIWYTGCAIST